MKDIKNRSAIACSAIMGSRLRQNDTNASEIYIGHPISISDVRYLYRTSGKQYPTSARAGLGLGLGQGYRTSDIDIECGIYILDVRYIYWTSYIYILDVRYRFR